MGLGVYLVTMGVGIIIVGHISNRLSKLHLLVAGYLLATICTFGYLLVHSSEMLMLFIVQGGLGVATALANPTHLALFARHSAGAGEGSAWGWADGRDKIAIGLAVFAGGIIVSRAGFEVLSSPWASRSLRRHCISPAFSLPTTRGRT